MSRFTHDTDEDALALGDRGALAALDRETRATLDHLFAWAALGAPDDILDPALVHSAPPLSITRSKRPTSMRATTMSTASIAPDAPARGRRMVPAMWTTFAWVLIAALAGASIYGAVPSLRDDGPAGSSQSAYQPGTATPESVAETGAVNYGGDAGRSWHLGDVEPTIGNPTVLGQLGSSGSSAVSQPLVVGDTVIATILDPSITDGSGFQTIRYDLTSGERLWTAQYPMFGPFATDGTYLYGLLTFPEENEEVYQPGAVWLDSGHLQSWFEAGHDETASGAGPVVVDEMGFFADTYGDVSVVDAVGIDFPIFQRQQTAFSLAGGVADEDVHTFRGPLPETALVISGDWLFVLRPSMTVVKYDRHTGKELDSFNLVDIMRGEIGEVTLQATQGRLVVTVQYADTPPDAAAQPANILFFESATMNLVARGELANMRSNLVVTPDWIYVVGRLEAGGPVWLYRMNPVGATFGAPFAGFEAPESASFGLSLSGSTLTIVGPPNAVAQIDVEREAVIQSGRVDLADGDSLTVSPMQLWGETPIAVSTGGAIVVFGNESAP